MNEYTSWADEAIRIAREAFDLGLAQEAMTSHRPCSFTWTGGQGHPHQCKLDAGWHLHVCRCGAALGYSDRAEV